jgi:long-chain fatty acid transport protein
VTPLLPDGTRNEITAGFSWRLLETAELSVAYQYLQQNDRRGRVQDPPPGQDPTDDLNSGIYEFGAHLAAASVTLHF